MFLVSFGHGAYSYCICMGLLLFLSVIPVQVNYILSPYVAVYEIVKLCKIMMYRTLHSHTANILTHLT